MCGLIYCNFIPENISILDVKSRGPNFQNQINHPFGYFYHSTLTTLPNCARQPYASKNGVLLYNGTEYYLKENDTQYIGDNLCDDFDKNLEFLKTLRGDFGIVFVTDNFVYCAKDWVGTKPIYFSSANNKLIFASTEFAISSINFYPTKLEPNHLYKFDRHSGELCDKKIISTFDYKNQTVNHYDKIFEQFEVSVITRFKTDKTFVNLSSGYDSGVIAACLAKNKKQFTCISFIQNEEKEIIKERFKLIAGKKHFITSDKIDINLYPELKKCNNFRIDNPHIFIAHYSSLYAKKLNQDTVLTGSAGDEFFSDFGFNGKKHFNVSIFGGYFPEQLEIIENWYLNYFGFIQALYYLDYIYAYNGIDARHPFIDKNLFQNFLNLSNNLKNNHYKSWMRQYMIETKFPFVENTKVPLSDTNKNILT